MARQPRFTKRSRRGFSSIAPALTLASTVAAAALPEVASINLCADQLVLSLADREQVLSVSWLAADPEESMHAGRARAHVLNYGSAEELLRLDPDVVVAGVFTNAFTRSLMRDLGFAVIDVAPANDVEEIALNLRRVGAAIAQAERAETLIEAMQARRASIAERARGLSLDAVVVRPGGFTAGRPSLADHLMQLAGLRNVAADQGLDRWGSLSMETLLASRPELIVFLGYRAGEPSMANVVLAHPALRAAQGSIEPVVVANRYWACGLPESLASAEQLVEAARGLRLSNRRAGAAD